MSVYRAELKGRDLLEIEVSDASSGGRARLRAVGCTELLSLVRRFQVQNGKDPLSWPLPGGLSHSELLLKEVLLKARGQWDFPYKEEELCHCRSVSTEIVDQAIVAGAHRCEIVSRQTSASTSCGTCRPHVQSLIDFRLSK